MSDLLHGESGVVYLQTPFFLAYRLMKMADLLDGMTILEPSAGEGRISDIVRRYYPTAKIHLVDNSPANCNILRAKGYQNVTEIDFMSYQAPDEFKEFDRVIMNPPFEYGLDAKHILHAKSLLKPNGKLVSVVSGKTVRQVEFQKIVKSWEYNPAYTFYNIESAIVTL